MSSGRAVFGVVRRVSVPLLASVLIVHSAAAQDSARSGLPPTVSLPPELAAVLSGYEAAWSRRDAAGLADLFTADGYVLRPGRPPARGRTSILAAYANAGGPLSLKAYAYDVDGSVGYIIGGYATDSAAPEVGKFVLALRRSPGGGWLITADIDNGN